MLMSNLLFCHLDYSSIQGDLKYTCSNLGRDCTNVVNSWGVLTYNVFVTNQALSILDYIIPVAQITWSPTTFKHSFIHLSPQRVSACPGLEFFKVITQSTSFICHMISWNSTEMFSQMCVWSPHHGCMWNDNSVWVKVSPSLYSTCVCVCAFVCPSAKLPFSGMVGSC